MNYQDIKNFLEGKSAESESQKILTWLKDDENEEESRRILGSIWSNHDIHLKGTKPDYNLILNQIHHRINRETTSGKNQKRASGNILKDFYIAFSRVAAILIIPILFYIAYLYFNHEKNNKQIVSNYHHEIYTKPGTRTSIDLPDGTKVWLNDGTTIRYPENFSKDKREVFVDGQAYFEVKSDSINPFIVNNPMINTIVTGTHFNINGYSKDQFFEATLCEGKITLNKNGSFYTMKAGEQIQFDVQKNLMTQKNVNTEDASSWINGKLILKDEKLGSAIKKIGRWYNVEFILSDLKLTGYLLTATVQDEKLNQTLKLISLALPAVKFEYKKVNKTKEIQRTIYVKKR